MTVLTLRIGPATGQASSLRRTSARCGRRCAFAEAASTVARPGTSRPHRAGRGQARGSRGITCGEGCRLARSTSCWRSSTPIRPRTCARTSSTSSKRSMTRGWIRRSSGGCSSIADVDIALAALDLLRARASAPLMRLLEQRLEAERKGGSREAVSRLMAEQERWTTLVRGGLLPTFFQTPPALFSVKPAASPIRVLAFGDFGDGGDPQKRVAAAMLRYHQQHVVRLRDYPRRQLLSERHGQPHRSALADLVERALRSSEDSVLRLIRQPRLEPAEQSGRRDPVLRAQSELADAGGVLHVSGRTGAVLRPGY